MLEIGRIDRSSSRGATVKLGTAKYGYNISNHIPSHISIGVFKYDPQDQFATYIPMEKLEIKS